MTIRRRCGTPDPPADSAIGAPPFVSQVDRVPAANLSNNAAQIASVMSPRAPTPSVAYSHVAVPAKGTSVASGVPLSPGTISTNGTHASCAVPIGHGPSSANGTRAHSAVPLSSGINSATTPPSSMAMEPALHAPLPPVTRRAAMRLLRRRVALLSERVHPLLFLTMWWRSV